SLFSLESENRNNIYELIMGISEVKINSAEESRLSNWRNTEDKLKKLKIKSAYIDFFMSDGNSFIAKLRDIVLLGVCAFLVIDDNMTMGVMLMVSYVLGQLSGPFNDLIRYIQNLQMIKLSFNRLSDVYLKEEEIDKNKRYSPLSNNNSILLENVSFQYGTSASELVLDKINLEIPNNKTTAIVGESGSGKSTLLKLFLGFYYPTFGNLYVGNNKITDINLKDWRKKCGVIMQEGYIFSGSILQNVTLSTLEPNREKFIQSLKIAELFDKMETLPMKEHTKIGEAGVSLSGGEKQRLLIARAVYKNPDFVFMDEATSSMDTIMEKNIMNNLKDFLQNRTAVIIAHRLSTIKNADNIIVMSDGEIVEQGTHSQLLGLKGKYYALVENQLESDPGKMAAHNIV
ncbi:MAG TPA: ABC transporter ATP-binding protein, partial [Algoriphagus sp.]|nr:ABC transporter ATP-binding protein [Algoriphagus sp.]